MSAWKKKKMKEEGVRQRRRLIRKEDYHMFVLCYFSVSIFHSFSLTLSHLPASCLFSFLVFLSFLSLPPILSISYPLSVFFSLSLSHLLYLPLLPSHSLYFLSTLHVFFSSSLSPSHPLYLPLLLSHPLYFLSTLRVFFSSLSPSHPLYLPLPPSHPLRVFFSPLPALPPPGGGG
uniref:Uncharacterized protein n=1 Tax=Cacopsylla melanoneura TaxID=428564 RepID=A0A8D9EYI1_9HEMI